MARTGSWLAPHMAARGDAELAGGDHALAALETFGDGHQIALALADGDQPQLRGGVLLDDVDERPLRRGLRGGGGNEHRVLPRSQHQADLDEATGPEMPVRVRHRRAQLDRPGAVL